MDITSLNNLKPIDILGLKNFRIFDDNAGLMEELASINILTGANNSGKSSIVKALQMLRNSIKGYKYPFSLDLNQQEHLLGDFDNILFNKDNKNVEITLPFLFMGIKNFSVVLRFETSSGIQAYNARLRGIDVIDKTDSRILFSFQYREARPDEKEAYKSAFEKELKEFNQRKCEESGKDTNIFAARHTYLFEPTENPLTAYVDWRIDLEKLKEYLSEHKKVYEYYLNNKKQWSGDNLKDIDDQARDMEIVPSSLIGSFKKDADLEKWKIFLEKTIADNKEITGKAHIGERDFDPEDYFIPASEIEDVLFYKISEILKDKIKWKEVDDEENDYAVIEHCFSNSWELLLQRIATINYVSNIKEENARIYNAASNSPFIKLLKSYTPEGYFGSGFMGKYLEKFEIGKSITIKLDPKYQSILVSITTMDGTERELVDFGYGIKQLVLIILQISVLSQQNKRSEQVYGYDGETIEDTYIPSLLIVEEPESNLHPKWQSFLADMFAEANRRFNIQLIIETHSEYLIRKFQSLVAKKEIGDKKVKLFYLRKLQGESEDKRQIDSLFIQEDGSINYTMFDNGFFDENYNLEMSLMNVRRDNFLRDFEKLKNDHQDSENKIDEMQRQVDDFVQKGDVSKYRLIIEHKFDVSKLEANTVTYLVSGQYLLENIDAACDYSPVIIQYGRAIENELKRIFLSIPSQKPWMLGTMQTQLVNLVNGNAYNPLLPSSFSSLFNVSIPLWINMIEDLRVLRNEAGHAGHTNTKQNALDYVRKANDFLIPWIAELK